MLAAVCSLLTLCLVAAGTNAAPAPQQDWQERYVDRELAAELYGILQNYLLENGPIGPIIPAMRPAKRNSEIINSLLALPKGMADVGRR